LLFYFSGTFFPNKEANLGASLPGRIEKFHYQAGAYVKEGSLLVELSAEALLQALIENQALRKDYERVSRLKEKGSISEMDYDHLKAKLEASDIKTEMFRKNTSVTAPFDGVIVEYLVEEGENYFFSINIEPGYSHTSGILRLMQLNPLKVIIEVNEKDLHHFSKGRQVRVICDALNNKEVIGKVKYIRPILSTVSRTAKIEIEVPNPKNEIMPGMFAKVIVNSDYFKGKFSTHLVGILGGIIWALGTSLSYIAAGKAGAAISYALGQGAPMIAALWGVFVWKEFKGSSKTVNLLLLLMFVLFIAGLMLIVVSGGN